MENKPEGKVNYVVEQSRSGQWEVNEEGFENPIASFDAKDDAIEYAQRLAGTKQAAEVRVQQ